jgi:SAM-dependent methyltransferase
MIFAHRSMYSLIRTAFRRKRKQWLEAITLNKSEEKKFFKIIGQSVLSPDGAILDVGCGYGRYLKRLRELGYENVVGVDINESIVRSNRNSKLTCYTPREFDDVDGVFDVMIMSHVLEHMAPDQLLVFIDDYLDRLKPAGILIIMTPVLTSSFFQDFDHIKPYLPIGINMVFCDQNSEQVQYSSRNKLVLKDIWFRRAQFRLSFCAGLYLSHRSKWPILVNILLALIFKLSGGFIGRTEGWLGVYEKKLGAITDHRHYPKNDG